jgi:hypothetical protein
LVVEDEDEDEDEDDNALNPSTVPTSSIKRRIVFDSNTMLTNSERIVKGPREFIIIQVFVFDFLLFAVVFLTAVGCYGRSLLVV